MEVLGNRSDNKEVHRHVAKFGLVLKLVMNALGYPDCGRNSFLCFALTGHTSTVASTRAQVVDIGHRLNQKMELRADADKCARMPVHGESARNW